MTISQNTQITFVIDATSYFAMGSYGKIMIGDKAFEYYNSKNIQDYIIIPWTEIEYIACGVIFNKYITRFSIFTKKNGYFSFSCKDNKKLLRQIREYIGNDKIVKSDTFFGSVKKGIKRIFGK